ncbi:beta-1,3-glucanosyltransferase [Histoplasma ohiense]|nr:beta-1,3-glucanosyltransferase [Histoplasma ohiense (nom. inval.)]
MKFSSVLAGAVLAGSAFADLDPIVIKGSKFFVEATGDEFFLKGVAYQEDISSNGTTSKNTHYKDPLANSDNCKRDIPYLKELGTNVIRVYAIDPEADHKDCMQMLQDAGIYVVADLSEPNTSINRDDPKWDVELYARYMAVVDELAPWSNTLGFFAGNEVSNQQSNTNASAFVKAAVRDTKSYIKKKGYRPMGVGYATNDDADIRDDMADYFNCKSRDESIDFWGYNIYSWCGDSSYKESGYDKVVAEFSTYSVPVFFAEYGCNEVRPRIFTEVKALYGPQMTPVVSGGIVYMYFQEENNYGLVNVNGDKVKPRVDYNNLKKQINGVNPKGVSMNDYKVENLQLRKCPATGSAWQSSATLPPVPNKQLCQCMVNSLSCVAKSSVDDEDLGKYFGTVCGLGKGVCDGIASKPEDGVYGAYSMCDPRDQLSFAFNSYFLQQDGASDACDFKGAAELQDSKKPTGTCADLLKQAGTDGKGTVTSAPNTGPGSTTSSAAIVTTIPAFNMGLLSVGAYVFCGVLAGFGIVLL